MAYFANGTEGSYLDEQCFDCPVGKDPDAPCPVLLVQSLWNYEQFDEKGNRVGPVKEILDTLINEKGDCQMRKVMKESKGIGMLTREQMTCPMCGSLDAELEHHPETGGFPECWLKRCAACGHEYDHT
jgi:hypothetical protein